MPMFLLENYSKTGWWCNSHLQKYESHWGLLFPNMIWKIKNDWNQQPENDDLTKNNGD